MEKGLIIALVFLIFLLPMLHADTIVPGTRTISITNQITNIDEYPGYVFISAATEMAGLGMCPVKIIESNGMIQPYYKFCDVYVYAIADSDFDQSVINNINNRTNLNYTEALALFESIPKIEVVSGIRTSTVVPDSSTVEEITNTYAINLDQIKTEPDNVESKVDYIQTMLYLLISLIALVCIVIILVRRKK